MQSLVGGGSVQTQLQHVDKYTFSKQRVHNHDLSKIQTGLKNLSERSDLYLLI